MDYYFAGGHPARRPPPQPCPAKYVTHRLLSYHYIKAGRGDLMNGQARSDIAMGWTMFLDSGAFSAFTKGVEINVKTYAKFIRDNGKNFKLVSALDSLNPDENIAKLKALEDELGERIACPVHHARDPHAQLEWMLGEGYPYILLGGMVPEGTGWLHAGPIADTGWLSEVWDQLLTNSKGEPLVKVHGFGMTDMRLARLYPWESVDSSSWVMTGSFGSCLFWLDHVVDPLRDVMKVEFTEVAKKSFADTHAQIAVNRKGSSRNYRVLSENEKAVVDRCLASLGVTAEQCFADHFYREIANAHFFARLGEKVAKTYKQEQQTLW